MARVTRTVRLPAAPAQVWEAVSSPDRLSRWLGWRVDLDVRPGGQGTARERGGAVRRLVVEDVEPARRLAFHWWPAEADGQPPESGASTVEIDLEPVEGGTLLRVTETALPAGAPVATAALALAGARA
ncbi:MAG: SRPBCC domain-containing protein [Egibacteraceae bacterium]